MIERYSRQAMRDIWSDEAKYASWSQVERAHLESLAEMGICQSSVLEDFDRACATKSEKDFLRREEETAHDVIAYVSEIGEEMGAASGPFLHRGLTSSDVLDTALALRLKESLQLIDQELGDWKKALAETAFRHDTTVTIGRTHGIHAEPTTFGQVLAGYFAEAHRAQQQVLTALRHTRFGKLSGAVGVYSQLDPSFEGRVLSKLGLEPETVATQVLPRDRLLVAVRAVEDAALCVERFATNVRHWARTELGEVLEPFGKKQKGSSAMPHKKNPVLAENLCGLARMVRSSTAALSQNTPLWHERDISHSSVERMALPDVFVVCDFMLGRVTRLTQNMDVSPAAMKKNLELTGGLWASGTVLTQLVSKGMSRTEAYELVQSVALPLAKEVRESHVAGDAFLEALRNNSAITKVLSTEELKTIFTFDRYLAHTNSTFKRVFGIGSQDLSWNADEAFPHEKVPMLRRSYAVTVQLQPDVLDTETKTISHDMKKQVPELLRVRQSRTFTIDLPTTHSGDELQRKITAYAHSVLHNAVMEDVTVEVVQ